MKVAVIGDGGWGTALALTLARHGHVSRVWGPDAAYLDEIRATRRNRKFLPGVELPEAIGWTADPDDALAGAEAVVMVVPSKDVRATLARFAGAYRAAGAPPVVSATKGFDESTQERMTEILSELWRVENPAALSGPSIAPETARGASMLLGVVTNGDIAVRDGDGSTVMLTLDTCRAAIRPVWDGGALARVDVTLRLRAGISELRTPRRITERAYQQALNAALAARVGGWVRDALAASQALEADFLGVGQAVAVRSGHRWAAIRDDWAELWPDVPVRVTVDADVGRTYDLRDGIDTSGGGT